MISDHGDLGPVTSVHFGDVGPVVSARYYRYSDLGPVISARHRTRYRTHVLESIIMFYNVPCVVYMTCLLLFAEPTLSDFKPPRLELIAS